MDGNVAPLRDASDIGYASERNDVAPKCLCGVKVYKKNGLSCGRLNCRTHTSSTKTPIALSRYLREAPAPLCYDTVAPVFRADSSEAVTVTLLCDVLLYVYSVETLRQFAKNLGYTQTTTGTGTMVRKIGAFMMRCWTLESSTRLNGALGEFQRRWRKRRRDVCVFVNEEDPITMEALNSIPAAHLWSYKDSKGHLYGFHAASLMHFIEKQGAWNPYTREAIPEVELGRLRAHVARVAPEEQTDFTVVWNSPRDAFSDILYDYEKYGFYTNIDWFLKLTAMNIVDIYTLLNADPFIPKTLFEFNALETSIVQDPETGAAYHLAREMRQIMCDNHDYKFYIVCNIFVALAKVCPAIRRALPPWTQAGARAIT